MHAAHSEKPALPADVAAGAAHVANQGASFMSEEDAKRVHAESERRSAATRSGGASTLADGGACTIPFKQDAQRYVLVNFANAGLRPQSEEPAFRVLGLFDSQESLQDHAEQIASLDPSLKKCNMHMLTTHAFYSVPLEQSFDIIEKQKNVNNNLLVYKQQLQQVSEEFQRHKAALTKNTKAPVTDFSRTSVHDAQKRINANKARVAAERAIQFRLARSDTSAAVPKQNATTAAAHESKADKKEGMALYSFDHTPKRLKTGAGLCVNQMSRACEVRNQNYLSVMVLRDFLGNDKEPAINVLGAFATEEECLRYNKYVAAAQIEDFDLHVKCMYEWTYPNMVFSEQFEDVDRLYRNEELDRIMRAHTESKSNVERFNAYFRQEKLDIPTIEVAPDLQAPAPRKYKPPAGSGLEGVAIGVSKE